MAPIWPSRSPMVGPDISLLTLGSETNRAIQSSQVAVGVARIVGRRRWRDRLPKAPVLVHAAFRNRQKL